MARRGGAPDLTVLATPLYFGSMELERRWLRRRADAEGPSPADYAAPDARTSLTMGVASLVLPLATNALLRRVTPGRGRYGKALIGAAVTAAAVTTLADQVAARRPDHERRARRVASVGGPIAVGAGWVAAGSTLAHRSSARRQWVKGERHDLGGGPLGWAVAVVGWDLLYYWNHRLMHEVRGLWAYHVVHHSSERYNLSTALRQPVADPFGVWLPYGLLARAGVRPELVERARQIDLLYQFWIHTDTIRSIGRSEEVLNAPSHHRVHHGRNPRYIDRNHGGILILWDRLFGTFQREDEPVVYGLTRNIDTFLPVRVMAHEYADIARDIAGARTWHDRLSFVLRGPGWAYARRLRSS
jgi:sterol desaturase/sphingolipid hydroxylase (fatty acid hydroxylase superfamily)